MKIIPIITHQPHSRHESYPKLIPEDMAHDVDARRLWLTGSEKSTSKKGKGGKKPLLYYGRTIKDWADELGLSISYTNDLKRQGKLGPYLASRGYLV